MPDTPMTPQPKARCGECDHPVHPLSNLTPNSPDTHDDCCSDHGHPFTLAPAEQPERTACKVHMWDSGQSYCLRCGIEACDGNPEVDCVLPKGHPYPHIETLAALAPKEAAGGDDDTV